MQNDKISKASTGFLWRLLERCGAQGVTFVVSIILARLLDPTVYGTIALVTVFTTIMQVFVDSGLGNALIQKKEVDDIDYSSVFYFNIAICLLIYFLMFALAPVIASFYSDPTLVPVIRVLSFTIVISGVKNIQQAYISRNLQFKKFFYATLTGTIGAAIIGITLAYLGFGVWSLVVQNLFNVFVDTIMLWILVDWRPKLVFSWKRLKTLLKYGYKLLASSLIDTIYNDCRQLVIGKIYSADSLAYYNRGQQYSSVFVSNINTSLDSVLLPVLSSEQDSKENVRSLTKHTVQLSSYVMMPLMVGMAVCAEPIVRLTLTEKWIDTVFFLRVFCFNYALYPINTANINAIKAIGRSDVVLKLEIAKKIVGVLALVSTMFISVKLLACSLIITSCFNFLINSIANKRLINYGFRNQLFDILPSVIMASLMGLIVWQINRLNCSDILLLLIQVFVGVACYVLLSIITKNSSFALVKKIVFRKKK